MRDYLGIIKSEELERLRSVRREGRTHPVANLALADETTSEAANTEIAARQIQERNPDWLRSQRRRLLDETDFTNASSALGEIRAYGALLEASLTVNPGPVVEGKNVVPEFEADAGDGPVIVEVHSRQMEPSVRQSIAQAERDVRAGKGMVTNQGATGKLVIGEPVSVVPFGAPDPKKKGDSVATNAISRIASIKPNETQVDPTKPFVLWLDLQDMTVWGLPLSEEHFRPLYSEARDGEVSSGAFWFALYGRKGNPMLEMAGCDYRIVPMLHEGRFYQTIKGAPTRVSAYVFSLPRATVLMEHPNPTVPLPPRFRASLVRTPHFRLALSVCEWEPNLVAATVDNQRRTVAATATALVATNPP